MKSLIRQEVPKMRHSSRLIWIAVCWNWGIIINCQLQFRGDINKSCHWQVCSLQRQVAFFYFFVKNNKAASTNCGILVFKAHQAECGELHALADQSQERLLELQKQHLAKTDEITRTLTEKHRLEVRCLFESKLYRGAFVQFNVRQKRKFISNGGGGGVNVCVLLFVTPV